MESVRVQLGGNRIGQPAGSSAASAPSIRRSARPTTWSPTRAASPGGCRCGRSRRRVNSRSRSAGTKRATGWSRTASQPPALHVRRRPRRRRGAQPVLQHPAHPPVRPAHRRRERRGPGRLREPPRPAVEEATLTYSSGPDGIHVLSPVSSSTVTVDTDGFVLDYPGLGRTDLTQRPSTGARQPRLGAAVPADSLASGAPAFRPGSDAGDLPRSGSRSVAARRARLDQIVAVDAAAASFGRGRR